MTEQSNKPCPICRHPTLENTNQPYYRYGVGDFDSYICTDCGFIAEFKIKKTKKATIPKEERDHDF